MTNYNKVILMGRLARDPELRYTQNNTAVCKFSLATSRKYKDGDQWNEKTTFVDVTMFAKRAEAFEKYHKKGDLAFIDGRLELDTWDDKATGQKRSKLYVVADNWEFTGGKHEGGSTRQSQPSQKSDSAMFGDAPADAGDFLGVDDTPF